jgi:hypothetical protein
MLAHIRDLEDAMQTLALRRIRIAFVAAATLAAAAAFAQQPGGHRGPPPLPTAAQVQSATGVDADTAAHVVSILQTMRQQQEQAHAQLRSLLTPEQLHKLRRSMRPPRRSGDGNGNG